MAIAVNQPAKWSDKIQLTTPAACIAGLVVSLLVLSYRLKPYFQDHKEVTVFKGSRDTTRPSVKLPGFNIGHFDAQFTPKGIVSNLLKTGSGQGGTRGTSDNSKNRVIERPLFDGMMVSLRAVLLQSMSSNDGSPTIQAKLLDGADLNGSYEVSFLKDATLSGTASPNLNAKRYNLQFSELITPEGKRYAVAAFAFDEKSQTVGIEADYSSGLVPRLAGSVLGQAIQVGQDIGTARVLNNSGASDSVASMEMNRALVSTSQQTTGDISTEATSGLVNTRPVVSLEAGTVFTVKLKANGNNRSNSQ